MATPEYQTTSQRGITPSISTERKFYPLTGEIINRGEALENLLMAVRTRPEFKKLNPEEKEVYRNRAIAEFYQKYNSLDEKGKEAYSEELLHECSRNLGLNLYEEDFGATGEACGQGKMPKEEALKKLEEEWLQERDLWEHLLSMGRDPVKVLEFMESFG